MTIATRTDIEMAGWIPVTRHYQVDGGYLAVSAINFFDAEGTEIFYCDEYGRAAIGEPIARFPHGTTHEQALEQMGYTVVDNTPPPPEPQPEEEPPAQTNPLDVLPPEILTMLTNVEQPMTDPTPTGTMGPSGG